MASPRNILSEKFLLEALDRVARNAEGYTVLYVNISKLKPKNRHPEFVKIIARLFDGIVGSAKGSLFILSNGDIAILSKNIPPQTIDEAVKKLRTGLSSDPILSQDSRDFALVYVFPDDFPRFYGMIEKMVVLQADVNLPKIEPKRPLEAAEVESIISIIDDIDISELVKRQSVLRINSGNNFKLIMQEFFVAVKDLSRYFDSEIDLVSNRWLFQYITQVLDKRTLMAFTSAEINNWPENISINLNLSSVFSKEFVTFAKTFLKPGQNIIVEAQMMDVLNNMNLYNEAKEILHKGGHKLLIDSLNPLGINMLNFDALAPDMIKIFWEPLMEYDIDNVKLKATIEALKPENIILAKCDGQEALKWGMSYGINTFQGPFMDDIEVAIIRNSCPDYKNCYTQECLKRRRLLQGMSRDECTQKTILEKLL